MKKIDLATASGRKVDDNQNSLTTGNRDPFLMQADIEYGTKIEKRL